MLVPFTFRMESPEFPCKCKQPWKLIWMGQDIMLMVPVTSIQKWDTGFSEGDTKF
jgi:hypothetical protein